MASEALDIAERLSLFFEHWQPKALTRLNDCEIKVVRLEGEFVWHAHQNTDELLLVVAGELTIQLRDGNVTLNPGQLFIVPQGVEHCPITEGEVHMLIRLNRIRRDWANYFRHAVYKHTLGSPENVAWNRVIRWWKHLPRWNWKDVHRHLAGPNGRWRRPTADGIELFNIASVPVTRY